MPSKSDARRSVALSPSVNHSPGEPIDEFVLSQICPKQLNCCQKTQLQLANRFNGALALGRRLISRFSSHPSIVRSDGLSKRGLAEMKRSQLEIVSKHQFPTLLETLSLENNAIQLSAGIGCSHKLPALSRRRGSFPCPWLTPRWARRYFAHPIYIYTRDPG